MFLDTKQQSKSESELLSHGDGKLQSTSIQNIGYVILEAILILISFGQTGEKKHLAYRAS